MLPANGLMTRFRDKPLPIFLLNKPPHCFRGQDYMSWSTVWPCMLRMRDTGSSVSTVLCLSELHSYFVDVIDLIQPIMVIVGSRGVGKLKGYATSLIAVKYLTHVQYLTWFNSPLHDPSESM
jgi:hypothetical protein